MSTSQNDGETTDAKEGSQNPRKSPEEQLKELKEKKTQLANLVAVDPRREPAIRGAPLDSR